LISSMSNVLKNTLFGIFVFKVCVFGKYKTRTIIFTMCVLFSFQRAFICCQKKPALSIRQTCIISISSGLSRQNYYFFQKNQINFCSKPFWLSHTIKIPSAQAFVKENRKISRQPKPYHLSGINSNNFRSVSIWNRVSCGVGNLSRHISSRKSPLNQARLQPA